MEKSRNDETNLQSKNLFKKSDWEQRSYHVVSSSNEEHDYKDSDTTLALAN